MLRFIVFSTFLSLFIADWATASECDGAGNQSDTFVQVSESCFVLDNVENLDLRGVTEKLDLEAIGDLRNLGILWMESHLFEYDFTPLRKSNLFSLHLFNYSFDHSTLNGLPITYFTLEQCQARHCPKGHYSNDGGVLTSLDLSTFSNLKELEVINYNDISGLIGTPTVQKLLITSNNQQNLEMLSSFENVYSARIHLGNTADLSGISGMRNLETLWLIAPDETSLEPLVHMGIEQLILSGGIELNGSQAVQSHLASLGFSVSEATICNISYPDIKNYQFGTYCIPSDAVRVDISSSNISHLAGIEEFENLEKLTFSSTQVSDISSLATAQQLTEVVFRSSPVVDLSPLIELPKLSRINMAGSSVTDFSALAEMESLSLVFFPDGKIVRGQQQILEYADSLR